MSSFQATHSQRFERMTQELKKQIETLSVLSAIASCISQKINDKGDSYGKKKI